MTEPPDDSPRDRPTSQRDLLAQATLRRVRGDWAGMAALCREAVALAPDSWEAHESLGDALSGQHHYTEAMAAYREAFRLNPSRGQIEEKIGRAALGQSEAERLRTASLEILEGRSDRPRRRPAVAALLSFLLPGLGQAYNREIVRSALFLLLLILFSAGLSVGLLSVLRQSAPGGALDPFMLISACFRGRALGWTLALLLLWVASIVDAALRAGPTLSADRSNLT